MSAARKTACAILLICFFKSSIATSKDEEESEIKIISQWIPPKCVRKVESGDFVRYHYYGMLTDGTYFDSSFERGRSYNTKVNSGWLIPGMDQALLGMCVNEHRIVSIPSNLAYGDEGTGDIIKGGATLLFNFILLDISNEKDTIQVTTTYLPPNCERKLVDTDFVRYHYNGTLMNGEPFHSSYDEEITYDTYVGKGWLIRGMDQGLLGSCMGERRTIIIPPQLAYGTNGDDKNIPSSATVRFDIEIMDFHNPKDNAVSETLNSKYKTDDSGEDSCPRRIEDSDFVRYHYNATLMDGTQFDSSYERNTTYDTYVGLRQLIAGIERGLIGMCVGDTRRITMPPHLGYGEKGVENHIPGSAVLVFDILLVDIHNPKDDVKIGILKAPPADCTRKAGDEDFVTCDYALELMDGTKIMSSEDTSGPWSTYLGRKKMVSGLEKVFADMCVGEVRKAVIPPHLGYGEQGQGIIPGSAVLVYTLELLKIEDSLPEGFLFVWNDGRSPPDNLFSLIDEDGDEKVTLEELVSYILKEVDSGDARILPGIGREEVVGNMLKEQDKDGDGFIQKSEWSIPVPHHDVFGDKSEDEL